MIFFKTLIQSIPKLPDTPTDIWSKILWVVTLLTFVIWNSWSKIKDFWDKNLSRRHELKKLEIEAIKESDSEEKKEYIQRISYLVKQVETLTGENGSLTQENSMLKERLANVKTGFDFLYSLAEDTMDDNPMTKKMLIKFKKYVDGTSFDR